MSAFSGYVPFGCYINAITLGQQTIVQFTVPHDFTVGEIISFRVSSPYGTVELNNVQTRVVGITTNTVTVDIDSMNYTPFVNAGIYKAVPAQAVPSSSGVIPNFSPPATNIYDVFDNVPAT